MKILIIGSGPLGSLYSCLMKKAGKDVTLLARGQHYDFLKDHGLILINEFTQEKIIEPVKVVDSLKADDLYDLIIVIMRKNSIPSILPVLAENKKIKNILFLGNNALGFSKYLEHLPTEKVLFGFPGGGGSRIDHIVHFIDREKPGGQRMPVTLGEIDGKIMERTQLIENLFRTSGVPVRIVDDMDSWLKYHAAFILPLAGALLKAGDNYHLAKDGTLIREYLNAVREGGRVLKALGFRKSYNLKFKLFYWLPDVLLVNILSKVFGSKFAEVAMMMHINAARDEMIELANEFKILMNQTQVSSENLDELFHYIFEGKTQDLEMFSGMESI